MTGLYRTFYASLAALLTWAAERKVARARRLKEWAAWADGKAKGGGA